MYVQHPQLRTQTKLTVMPPHNSERVFCNPRSIHAKNQYIVKMDALENYGLAEVDIHNLFSLQSDLKPIDICKEGTWDLSSGALLNQLQARWAHVTGALAEQQDEVGQKLANNAIAFIRLNPPEHWDLLLSISISNRNRTSSRCRPCCSRVAVLSEEAEDGDDSSPVPDGPHKAKPLAATQCARLEPSPTTIYSDEQVAPVDTPTSINEVCRTSICICRQPFDTLRSLIIHGQFCHHVDNSARAKSFLLRTRAAGCIYGCPGKSKSSWDHEQRPHYICCCGNIGTKGSSHLKTCWSILIEPIRYFLHPPINERPSPQSILHKMLVHQPECALRALARLDGPSLLCLAQTTLTALIAPRGKKKRKRGASVDIQGKRDCGSCQSMQQANSLVR